MTETDDFIASYTQALEELHSKTELTQLQLVALHTLSNLPQVFNNRKIRFENIIHKINWRRNFRLNICVVLPDSGGCSLVFIDYLALSLLSCVENIFLRMQGEIVL